MNLAQRSNVYPMPDGPKQVSAQDEASARLVLRDLYELLETYAPVWYTEEHHNQASQVLNTRA